MDDYSPRRKPAEKSISWDRDPPALNCHRLDHYCRPRNPAGAVVCGGREWAVDLPGPWAKVPSEEEFCVVVAAAVAVAEGLEYLEG